MKLYYIAGASRSGSTVFAQALSSVLDAYNIGEYFLNYCNEKMYIGELPCSCGSKPSVCPIWREEGNHIDVNDLKVLSKKSRMRNIFFKLTKTERDYFKKLIENLSYKFGNESIIIETSKSPAFLRYLLSSKINLTVIHLTRNPYDSVNSWLIKKKYLDSKSFWGGVHDWFMMNYLTFIYSKLKKLDYVRVKYENFCEDPKEVLSYILKRDCKDLKDKYITKRNVFESPHFNHALAGNPSKFDSVENITIKNSRRQKKPVDFGIKGLFLKFIGLPFRY